MTDRDPLYRRHRFPAEIIAHAVWLYFRFPLSLRMVEDMLAARGIIVSHQTVRPWAEKFGRAFASEIRCRSAGRLGDKWHLDEAVVSIRGKKGGSGAKSSQCQGGQASDAQTVEGPRPRAASGDHRQASVLRRCKTRDYAKCRTPLT
jgi:putative transposase